MRDEGCLENARKEVMPLLLTAPGSGVNRITGAAERCRVGHESVLDGDGNLPVGPAVLRLLGE